MKLLRRFSKRHYFRQTIVCFLTCCIFFNTSLPVVLAGPEGAQVVNGQVTFQQSGYNTTITASDRSIINYSSFDIARPEIVEFIQPSSSASVLNRILSANPTNINGTLLANGRVFFVNPAGVYIGAGARINVNQLVASGLNISNSDFINGRYNFAGGNGSVINAGDILAEKVYLIGKQVANSGNISCPAGYVVMAAGDRVFIGEPGSDIVLEIEATSLPELIKPVDSGPAVLNEGTIAAAGGTIVLAAEGDIYSQAISNVGSLSVSVETDAAGQIKLIAPKGQIVNSGTIEASGDVGGAVLLDGGEVVLSADSAIHADGMTADAGDISIHGTSTVEVGSEVLLTADAQGDAGDGGSVIVLGDEMAIFEGTISAQGGQSEGDGGFAEVSGKHVIVGGHADLTAAAGQTGEFLIDPGSVNIVDGDDTGPDPLVMDTFNDGWIESQLGTSLLTIDTTDSENSNAEVIDFASNASVGWATGNEFKLKAGERIDFKGTVSSTGGGNFVMDSPTVDLYSSNITVSGGGELSGTATTVNVKSDAVSIGTGIAVANNTGATVNVASGMYTEDLQITKDNLELAGADRSTTTIKGVANVDSASFPLAVANIEILGNDVSIHDFTIEGPDPVAGRYSSGIVIGGDNVEIYNNDIKVTNASTLDDISQGIQTYRDAANPTGGDVDGLNIHDNDFTALGAGTAGYEAIFINHVSSGDSPAGRVTISNNTFNDEVIRAITTERSKTDITNNTVNTTLTAVPEGGSFGVGNNLLGVQVIDYSGRNVTDVTFTGNKVDGFTKGLRIGLSVSADGVTVTGNSFTNNTLGVQNEAAAILDASGNWYGTNTAAGVAGQVSANVDYTPWLDSGTDTDLVTPGFQGDFSTLHVDDDSPQVGTTGHIQEGINMVSGSTVIVEAGTYTEDLTIDKSVTLEGAQAGNAVSGRDAEDLDESTVAGLHTVTASDVTIDGFSFADPSVGSGDVLLQLDSSGGAIDDVTLRNNFVTMGSGDIGVGFGGNSSTNQAITNVAIEDSVFSGPGDKVSNPMRIGGWFGSDVDVEVDGVTFQRNTVDKGSIPIQLQDEDLANITIAQNTFTNTDGTVYVWGNDASPAGVLSNFEYSENSVDSTNTYGVGIDVFDAFDNSNFGGTIEVINNSFDGVTGGYGFNAVSILSSGFTTGTIDASGNWYGTNDAAGVAAEVSANVDYTPWLDVNTDTDLVTPGFQGDFSTLHVDAASPQTGATGRIQEAINLLTAGPSSSINAVAGTYDDGVVNVNKQFEGLYFLGTSEIGNQITLNENLNIYTQNNGNLTLNTVSDGGTHSLLVDTGDGTLNLYENVTANSGITLDGGIINVGNDASDKIASAGAVSITGTGTVTINAEIDPATVTIASDTDVDINAAVTGTTSVDILAGQNVMIAGLVTGGTIGVGATAGDVTFDGAAGALTSDNTITVDAGGSITNTASTVADTIQATGSSATLTAGDNISALTITSGTLANLETWGGGISGTDASASAGDVAMTANNGLITDSTATALNGNVTMWADGGLISNSTAAAGALAELDSLNGNITGVIASGDTVDMWAADSIIGSTATAVTLADLAAGTGDISSTDASAENVNMIANNGSIINSTAIAGLVADLVAINDITGTDASGEEVYMTSGGSITDSTVTAVIFGDLNATGNISGTDASASNGQVGMMAGGSISNSTANAVTLADIQGYNGISSVIASGDQVNMWANGPGGSITNSTATAGSLADLEAWFGGISDTIASGDTVSMSTTHGSIINSTGTSLNGQVSMLAGGSIINSTANAVTLADIQAYTGISDTEASGDRVNMWSNGPGGTITNSTATAGTLADLESWFGGISGTTASGDTVNMFTEDGSIVNSTATAVTLADLSSTNGDISGIIASGETVTMLAGNNISEFSVNATTANLTATAGAITDSDVDTDITADTVTLIAGTGIHGSAIETSVTTIAANTANGDIDIDNSHASNVTATSLTTGTGNILFSQAGGGSLNVVSASATDGNIGIDVTDGDLMATVNAGGVGSANLDANGGNILDSTVTADSAAILTATGDISSSIVSGGAVWMTAGGSIINSTAVGGYSADLTAQGGDISGTSATAIIESVSMMASDSITDSTANGGYTASLTAQSGDISGTSATAIADSVWMTADGSITDSTVDAGALADLDALNGDISGTFAEGYVVEMTAGGSITGSTAEGQGFHNSATLIATGNISGSTADASYVTMTAGDSIINSTAVGEYTVDLTANTGNISGFYVDTIIANLTATTGEITDSDGDTDITADTVTLIAGTGIHGSAIETSVTTIAANTANGNIDIDNTHASDVTATSLTTGTGNILLSQAGGGALDVVLATTTDGSIGIDVTGADLTAQVVTAGGAGNVGLLTDTSGDIKVDNITALDNTITITSAGLITEAINNLAVNLTADELDLNAVTGIGTLSSAIDTSATTIAANTTEDDIEIYNTHASDVTVSSLTSGTGLLVSGHIVFRQAGGGSLDVTSASTTQGTIGIEVVDGGDLKAIVNAGGIGSASLNANGGNILDSDVTAGSTATLVATGDISSTDARGDVVQMLTNGSIIDSTAEAVSFAYMVANTGNISGAVASGEVVQMFADDSITNSSANAGTLADLNVWNGDISNVIVAAGTTATLLAADNISGFDVDATTANLTATSGYIADADGAIDITATTANLVAETGIGETGNAIDTDISSLKAHTTTGDIAIVEKDDVELHNILADSGSIYLEASDGGMTHIAGTITAGSSTLTMVQLDPLDTKDFTFTNQADTDLMLQSTGSSVTAVDTINGGKDDNAADKWKSIQAIAKDNIELQGSGDIKIGTHDGYDPVNHPFGGVVVSSDGGVSIISDNGTVRTVDESILDNVTITGYSDGAQDKGVSIPNPLADEGIAAIVIVSEDNLAIGAGSKLTAKGVYDPTNDERADSILEEDGFEIDVAIYLRSVAGNVTLGSTVSPLVGPESYIPLEGPGALVVDAYDTVTFNDSFEDFLMSPGSPIKRIDVVSRITETLNTAVEQDRLPHGSNPQEVLGLWNNFGLGFVDSIYVLRGENGGTVDFAWLLGISEPVPLVLPAPLEPEDKGEVEETDKEALMQWLVDELGEGNVQTYLARAYPPSLHTDLRPYKAAARLQNFAAILKDPAGAHIAALGQVIGEVIQADVPPSPEQSAMIVQGFAEHVGDDTHYALAGQWIDALAEYTGTLNSEIGWSTDKSIAFVMGKYGSGIRESGDLRIAMFVQTYLEQSFGG